MEAKSRGGREVNYHKLLKLKKVWMEDERYIYAVGVGQVKIMMC